MSDAILHVSNFGMIYEDLSRVLFTIEKSNDLENVLYVANTENNR